MDSVLCVRARTDHEDGAANELRENAMDDGGAPRRRASRWTLTVLAAVLAALPTAPTASANPGATVSVTRGVTVDAAVATGSFVDVFATSGSPSLQVDGQDGRFPTTVMSHDPGSTRFYARLSVAADEAVTTVTVRAPQDVPPSTATADVRAISVTQASFDGTALTVAASAGAPAAYPLRVEAGGVVGELPSPAPVSFPLAAPPASITVSSGAVRTSAPVVVTGGTAATTTAHVAAAALTAPRGVATVIDGRGSTNATTFRTVIKSGPQGAVLVDDTTSTPRIVLPTWAAPTDVLPRVAPAAAPTVVTFTASDGGGVQLDRRHGDPHRRHGGRHHRPVRRRRAARGRHVDDHRRGTSAGRPDAGGRVRPHEPGARSDGYRGRAGSRSVPPRSMPRARSRSGRVRPRTWPTCST